MGGHTLFDRLGSINKIYVDSLRPVAGCALLLDHFVLHSGACLSQGTKYILRTEVFYSSSGDYGDEVDGVGDLSDFELRWAAAGERVVNRADGDGVAGLRRDLAKASAIEEERVQVPHPQDAFSEHCETAVKGQV